MSDKAEDRSWRPETESETETGSETESEAEMEAKAEAETDRLRITESQNHRMLDVDKHIKPSIHTKTTIRHTEEANEIHKHT